MNDSLSNLLSENRTFPPSPEFAAQANAKADMYDEAERDRLAFWEKQASVLHWHQKWTHVLDWQPPFAKWFVGGKLNASYNALDRHVIEGRGDRVAFLFEGEPGDTQKITYAELLKEVKKAANALQFLGIKDGDRVAIYMPMILKQQLRCWHVRELERLIAWSSEDFRPTHYWHVFKMPMQS